MDQLTILGTNLIKADGEYKIAAQRLLDASDEMRKAMHERRQYSIVVKDKILRWTDGIVKIEG